MEAQRDHKVAALTLPVGMEAQRDHKVAALTLAVGTGDGGTTHTQTQTAVQVLT